MTVEREGEIGVVAGNDLDGDALARGLRRPTSVEAAASTLQCVEEQLLLHPLVDAYLSHQRPSVFGKLREHELELGRLKEYEEIEEKKSIALKAISKKATKNLEPETESDADIPEKEMMIMMVRKFSRFMKNKNFATNNAGFSRGGKKSLRRNVVQCYEYEKDGHIKPNYPDLRNKQKEFTKVPSISLGFLVRIEHEFSFPSSQYSISCSRHHFQHSAAYSSSEKLRGGPSTSLVFLRVNIRSRVLVIIFNIPLRILRRRSFEEVRFVFVQLQSASPRAFVHQVVFRARSNTLRR
ncbi:hypothetical protein LR48_Vigan05g089700 [Vigna angularis]|uniref:Uncharacterized protein n=1 Tax=Phaseolus angularis TaxID=3914 RepID=A0A0L9UKK5_PHAAN|nr:hypothetical protein LR48_Vigan05g089700 [Vigna angularis]